MKIRSECIPCLFERAKFECDLAFGEDEAGKLKALNEIASYAAEKINPETVPAQLGTERGRIIIKLSGVDDPYRELKHKSNMAGREILATAKEYIDACDDRVLGLLRVAAAANSMEYGVRGHEFDDERFKKDFMAILDEPVSGNLKDVLKAIKRSRTILYILDNAGEAVLDKLVVDELIMMGKDVFISPKSEPVINDITKEEAIGLGFDRDKILASGSYVGVSIEEAPNDFLEKLFDPNILIIAKGMGNYETLSEREEEFQERLIYLLRAKCSSVAGSIGVKQGTLVIDLVKVPEDRGKEEKLYPRE